MEDFHCIFGPWKEHDPVAIYLTVAWILLNMRMETKRVIPVLWNFTLYISLSLANAIWRWFEISDGEVVQIVQIVSGVIFRWMAGTGELNKLAGNSFLLAFLWTDNYCGSSKNLCSPYDCLSNKNHFQLWYIRRFISRTIFGMDRTIYLFNYLCNKSVRLYMCFLS